MKSLLLKDVLVLLRQSRLFTLLTVLLALCSGFKPEVLHSIAILYAVLLPLSVLAYDERSGWDRTAVVMPYSTASLVGSKYLLGILGVLGVSLLSLLSEWLFCGFVLKAESFSATLLYACFVLLMLAVALPPMFRFGAEKGRLFYIVLIGAFVALAIGLGDRLFALPAEHMTVWAVVAAVAALPVSFAFSVMGYHAVLR